MGRKKDEFEEERETFEANMGRLGNALVYLHLVLDRVQAAARVNGQGVLLEPAVDDCRSAQLLIREVQTSIKKTFGE